MVVFSVMTKILVLSQLLHGILGSTANQHALTSSLWHFHPPLSTQHSPNPPPRPLTKQQDTKYDFGRYEVFAPCATSVKAYTSKDNFMESIPFERNLYDGTFFIDQQEIVVSSVADKKRDSSSPTSIVTVIENDNTNNTHEVRMSASLPTCRELHPRETNICLVMKEDREPLPPLFATSPPLLQQNKDFQRIIYELHVPSFSPEGTFDGCITRLEYLLNLGITTVQLMPVTVDYDSSWGYSTAHPFAIRSSLGGYRGLRRFIRAAHAAGLEVFMDVVYNHASAHTHLYNIDRCELRNDEIDSLPITFCPSNGFQEKVPCSFGKYFYNDDNQMTPWGPRYDYSSKQVREYLLSNIKYWIEELGIDGLRFDSTICIRKTKGRNAECWQPDALDNPEGIQFLRESTSYLSKMNRFSIAEDLEGEPSITESFFSDQRENNRGLGFDAKWDNNLAAIFQQTMQFKDSVSVNAIVKEIEHRCNASSGSFISYTETHDIASSQEGGNGRSASIVEDFVLNKELVEQAKVLPIALTLLSCGTPMIFQGQEIGETKPFFYPEPMKHDWEDLGIVWETDRDTKDSYMCYTRDEEPNRKLQTFHNVRNLIKTMSMTSPLSNLEISQNDISGTSLHFHRTDVEGKVLSGVMNFHESAFELESFEVPVAGSWTIAFGVGYGKEAMNKVYNTVTIDGKHFLKSLQIQGMTTLLLTPTTADENIDVKEEPKSCRLNALKSVDKKNLKYFDQTYWKDHIFSDLYPFWNSIDALGGDKYGNFPTFRCNDGTAFDKAKNPCPEIQSSPGWIANYTDFDIAVQHSRQIFFYSASFHITGSSEMLRHAKAGIDIFFEKYAILHTGAICTYKSKLNDACLPLEIDRTSMEHANALIGLSMYYYVTRDEYVANFIYKSVDYAFTKWYRSDLNMMGMAERTSVWPPPSVPVLEGEPLEDREDMLAQLDQLNAYMMILRGLAGSQLWKDRMFNLALALKSSFWSEKYNIMWGNANYEVLDSVHSDFGHSQKSLWFIMMVAEHVEDPDLFKWAYTRAMRMLPLAWLPRRLFHNTTTGETGTWAFDRTQQGISRSGHVWWVFAELSQTAAYMSVSNPSIASTISSKAYAAYMNLFVDNNSEQKGVFHWKDYITRDTLFAKGHIWKNGFHEAEHALIAMIASAALQSTELQVYYAPKRQTPDASGDEDLINKTVFYPGFFKGDLVNTTIIDDTDMLMNHVKTAVNWTNVRSTDLQPDPACRGVLCSGNGICYEGKCLCLHGWTGSKCEIDPCENHITIVPSEKHCGQCQVTFTLNPATILPQSVSSVMVSGSFSNWSAIEMNLRDDDVDQSDDSFIYSKLYPEDSFYHGMSSSRSYSVDLHIPHGQNHTYKFVLDHALWSFDKCNPNAISDGMETMDLNSILYVSCPNEVAANPACEAVSNSRHGEENYSAQEDVILDVEDLGSNNIDSGSVVQLFEWTFSEVAKECKRLGEEGWVAVQLSPVNAHLVLAPGVIESFNMGEPPRYRPTYAWWQRYQPASYKIKSRSGTEAELRATTAECARHGVQVWVELGMNSMNAAPCCDIPGPLDYRTCDGFFSDDSKSCAPERSFPSAGFDAGDLHSPPCGIGDPGTWGSPDVTWNCDMTGMPDLNTSSEHVQTILANYIDHLLEIGVSGFRVLAAGHMDSKDIREIFAKSRNEINEDIFKMTSARSRLPVLIIDLWPSWLVRFPHLQPDFYPDEMTPYRYNGISDNAYNTDLAFSFIAGDTFYRKDSAMSLKNLTEQSTTTRFSHPMYKQKTDLIPLGKLILQMTNHFLTFYGVEHCPQGTNGTVDVKNVFHKNVCPTILSTAWNEKLLVLGTIWMMTLPVGYTRVYSSYDWDRFYERNEHGQPFDRLFSTGPPRNVDGGTRDVVCGYPPEVDISPAFVDDGNRWMCEHRDQSIGAMPKWRLEVARSNSYQLKLNEWFGDDDVSDYFVSISRSMRQGENGPLRGGWVAINADPHHAVQRKFATRLPAGVYRNHGANNTSNSLLVVDSRGILETKLEPFESIIIHTADMTPDTHNTSLISVIISFILWLWIPAVACYLTIRKYSQDRDIVVRENSSAALAENGKVMSVADANSGSVNEELFSSGIETSAMICTLEHIVPETSISEKVNQKVGGLGKVVESIAQFHPGPLVMVTPMMGSVCYPAMKEAEPIICTVDSKEEVVRIFHYRWTGTENSVESIFCQHDKIFGSRTAKDEDLYPNDGKDLDHFLSFFALWSQTVAKLVQRHRKQLDVLHLCDYHTAFAPTFIKAYGGSIPVLCTLHNASYQGSIKNNLGANCLSYISKIVGISEEELATNFTLDDEFNMLSGLISYFRQEQNGHGFCAVSKNYAKEIPMLIDSFRVGKVPIRSLPNPELKSNRPKSLNHMTNIQELSRIKRQKKIELQQALGLRVDPDAMIAAFVGRLVVQKGVDAIADAATELLLRHKKLQLIVVGPIGDVFGRYASTRLMLLSRNKMFGDRIFCVPKFFRFTSDFRLGCDFALMPSRSEPFGFVDIEFAWCGCPVVGSLVGGLGKVPGWYFKLWEGGNFKHLKTQLCRTVDKVMEEGHDKVLELGLEAIQTSFPVLNWQKQLSTIYQDVIKTTHTTSIGCMTNLLGRKYMKEQLTMHEISSSSECDHNIDESMQQQLWSLSSDEDLFLVQKVEPQKKVLLKDVVNERQEEENLELDVEGGKYSNLLPQVQRSSGSSSSSSDEPYENTVVEGIPLCSSDHQSDSHQNKSHDEYVSEVLEANTTVSLFTGKKTNVLTVFKSTIWNQKWSDVPDVERSSTPGVVGVCERMLEREISGRSVQSWLIAVLSIMMPSHSTLLYAKSIVWAKAYHWDDNEIGGLYAAHFASYAIACIVWPQILRHISVGHCVAVSSQLHMVSILFFTNASDSGYFAAILIAAATGIVSSANGPIFTAAMFFDEWDGSLASKMRNFGWIEGSRTIFSGILQGAIIIDFMSLRAGERMLAPLMKSSLLFNIYMIIGFITVLGSSLLLLGMKKNIRLAVLPRVKLSSVLYFKSFSMLSLSSILEGVISYPTLFIISWLLLDGFSAKNTGSWVIVSSSAIGLTIYAFALLFNRIHQAPKCISVLATHLPQPVLLQTMIMMAAPNMSANQVLVLLGVTSFLIKLKGGLIAVLKLHVLQSRWKAVTYSCYELFLTNLASAASPFIMRSVAKSMNLSLNTVGPGTSPEASAAASFYTVLPFVIMIMILQLIANKYAFLDISEIYTKVDFYKKEK